jgi:hypothetical protein
MMEQQIITQEDLADLEHAEAAISRAMKNAFEEVGAQLDHINGRGLYSLRKPTFAQYVEAYWEMSEQRAYQLIAAWKAYTIKGARGPRYSLGECSSKRQWSGYHCPDGEGRSSAVQSCSR